MIVSRLVSSLNKMKCIGFGRDRLQQTAINRAFMHTHGMHPKKRREVEQTICGSVP